MKHLKWMTQVLLLVLLSSCATQSTAGIKLLPGVTYYKGFETLTGKLLFLLSASSEEDRNEVGRGAIYELDLSEHTLRKVADSPSGILSTSRDGNLTCVVCWLGSWRNDNNTNVFIYSLPMRRARNLSLESTPKATVIIDDHVFFQIENSALDKHTTAVRLVEYSVTSDEKRLVELPGASRWQYETYDMIHAPTEHTNVLHFHYVCSGNRLEIGRDYQTGVYSLDVCTGDIKRSFDLAKDEDDGTREFKTFEGNRIYFVGAQGPDEGVKLVMSPWDEYSAKRRDPRGEKSKVLHYFPKSPLSKGGSFVLNTISPDGHFALVVLTMPARRASGMLPGSTRIYYLVDSSNGHTRVLLKDDVDLETGGSMSPVHWIQGR